MKVWIFYNDAAIDIGSKFNVFGSKDAAVRYVMDLYESILKKSAVSEDQLKRWAEDAIDECEVRDDY